MSQGSFAVSADQLEYTAAARRWVMMFGVGYIGVQGSWFAELYPTHARTTGQNFVYYVSRAFGAGIGPLLALSLATEWGFDVRMAIALGAIGSAGTGLVSRMLPETRGAELRNE
jgi:MFS family permease